MHWEQTQFIRSVRLVFPAFFRSVSVLEVGSYDVNGSIRSLFDATHYVGVDLIPGPGVDVICPGQDFRTTQKFDVAVSTECFEHNPFYIDTFLNMTRHVREGGMVLFTCAGEGRPEHGTRRCEPTSSPGSLSLDPDYYKNLTEEDFAELDTSALFARHRFFRNDVAHDLYFVGFTPDPGSLDRLADHCATSQSLSAEVEAALTQSRVGQTAEAVLRIRRACDGAPVHIRDHLLSRLAWLLKQIGKLDAAEAAIREALSLSDSADLHWQCAIILHAMGRIAAAAEAARRAVDRAPTRAQFVYFLGAMLQAENRLEEAENHLQRATRLDPTLAAAFLQLSMVHIKQGRWPDAKGAATRALELAPHDATVRQHLEQLGRRTAAQP